MPAMLLPQLVDLALGTPEVGAVNFNVLHTLLHAMISKLGLGDAKAELSDFDRDLLSTVSRPTKTCIPGSDKDQLPPSRANVVTAGASDRDSARGDDSLLDESTTETVDSKTVDQSDAASQDASMVRRTPTAYHQLENRVAEIAKALEGLNALPTTHEFLIEVKGEMPSNKRAVNNMWQSLQVKKKVETNEEGIEKLTMMMEDLMMELNGIKAENQALRDSMKNFADLDFEGLLKRLSELEKLSEAMRNDLDEGLKDLMSRMNQLPTPDEFLQFVRWGDLEDALRGIRNELERMAQPEERVYITCSSQTEKIESRPASVISSRPSSGISGPSLELLDILETLGNIGKDHVSLNKRVTKLEEEIQNKLDKGSLEDLGPTEELLKELSQMKKDIEALQKEVGKLKGLPTIVTTHVEQPTQEEEEEEEEKEELKGLSGVDEELRAQVDEILKKIGEDSDAIGRLQKMLALLEESIDRLTHTTRDLSDDSVSKGKQIVELYGLCKDLDYKKADKEYVAMEVDVKADKKQLESKVNHNLFDNTTAEINKAIKDILEQLAGNSDEWKNMLAKLMNDLDGKLDRMELNPLKEWLEQKLKALSKKIQDGNLQWSEDEAAGLKRQLIQHYHCLSCDKPLEIMPTGLQPNVSANQGMPPSRSPRPYTTYELDQIRQHAKSFGTPTDQLDFYATSRQCGGSHTTTLPHQRFSRFTPTLSSLFREDEQQEVIPIKKEEVDVMGADGHIYRGRVQRLEAKIPPRMTYTSTSRPVTEPSSRTGRPASARNQGSVSPLPRQQTARGTRPQSARMQMRGELLERSGISTPPPYDNQPLGVDGGREMSVEVPGDVTSMHGE